MRQALIKHVTATGDITTSSVDLYSVVLSGGSDAASAVVKAGGSSGTTILTLKAAAGVTVPVALTALVPCADGIHVTLTGTSPAFTAVYA